MDKSARFSLTSTPKEPARVSPLMDSNKAHHDGKYVGDDITEITKKVRANSYLTDFGHLSGSSYPTDSGDFVDVCLGDFVDVGHLAGNSYQKEPARVSPLMDSNKAHEEVCHEEIWCDGIDVGDDMTEIGSSYPTDFVDLGDWGHLKELPEICHDGKYVGDDITEIPTKLPANSSLRDFEDLGDFMDLEESEAALSCPYLLIVDYIGKISETYTEGDGPGTDSSHDGKYIVEDITVIPRLFLPKQPVISFPLLSLIKQLLIYDDIYIDKISETYSEGHIVKYVFKDITEILTKLPAISYRQLSRDLRELMAQPLISSSIIDEDITEIPTKHWVRVSQDGEGMSWIKTELHATSYQPLLKDLRDLREPAISFPPLLPLKQLPQLRINFSIIDVETYSYSEGETLCYFLLNGDVPRIESRHNGKYFVLDITEILTKLPAISYRPLLKNLREPAISIPPLPPLKLLPQLRIDFSIIDAETYSNSEGDVPGTESRHDCKYVLLDITEIPTMLRDGVFQDDEGTSRIKTEPYQQLLMKLPAISFPRPFLPKPPGISFPRSFLPKLCAISLTKQPLISSSIVDDDIDKISETNSEVDILGTESRWEKT